MENQQLHPLLLRGQEALQKKDFEQAKRFADLRLADAPDDASAHELRYLVHVNRGETEDAIGSLRQVLEFSPTALWAAEELAVLLFETDKLSEAEEIARHALRLNPLRAQGHNMLGMIFTAQNKLIPGEWHYRRTMELAPAHPKLLANLAYNLREQGRLEESEKTFEEAVRLEPDNPATLVDWARLCEIQGKIDQAHALLDRVENLVSASGGNVAIARAILLSRQKKYEEALQTLETSRAQENGAPIGPMRQLERGRLYDKLGRYREAWADFVEAKERLSTDPHTTYDTEYVDNLFFRLKSFFNRDQIALIPKLEKSQSSAQPIFILGFPRSGTTMTEQVIGSHSQVQAGGELTFIPELTRLSKQILNSPYEFPETLAELWMADKRHGLQVLRDYYLGRAQASGLFKSGKPYFTDKLPLNETYLLFIQMIFPEAKFVHLIRHPLDIAVSVMSNYLTHGFNCGFKLETFAHHYAAVFELVSSYLAQGKLNYYPLRYETFVQNQREETQKLLDFLGLPFEEACLSFHQSKRFANTASYAQVTQKLYDSSVGRYKHYLEFMQPVLPVLKPALDQLGYEV
jgi:tetratricopeptide (TPR) repeat protein